MSDLIPIVTPNKDLDVLSKYRDLLAESLGADSVYIRTKETYEALAASGDLKDADKAKVLAETLSSMNGSLANACMQSALQWATAEKDIEFKKLETGRQLQIMDEDVRLRKAQVEKTKSEDVATQAQTLRLMGKPQLDGTGKVSALAQEGKHYKDILLTEKQTDKVGSEKTLTDSKLQESYAIIHKTVADTLTNYGAWTYKLSADGMGVGPADKATMTPVTGVEPLSDVQRVIAKEQAKGYSYNAWANAVTASAGMLGTLIASDSGASTQAGVALTKFDNLLDALATVTNPYA